MVNNAGSYTNAKSQSTSTGGYQSITPNTVDDDEQLQQALNNGTDSNSEDDRALGFNSTSWGGMKSGAIKHDTSQNQNWYENIPDVYKSTAYNWLNQQGVMKVTPLQQRQKFTYTTVAYIAKKTEEPKTQVFPISDVNVVPHQITFDFYDTTEGRVGVSHAVEKHMSVECDVYLTDLLAQYWIFGDDDHNVMGMSILNGYKRAWWNAVEDGTYLSFEGDLENTTEFAEFRTTFLQQHSGWVCRFTSHTFGVFQGVFTDVSYTIGSGETFAKWHLKFEEAIFTGDYSKEGQKPQEDSTSNGSTSDSGDATTQEEVDTSTQ